MKLVDYIKDKYLSILVFIFSYIIILLMLLAFKSSVSLIIAISMIFMFLGLSFILINFYRKKNFYDNFKLNLERLDQKYLVLPTIEKPSFYEGEILYDSFYEINKSMLENIKNYESQMIDFKEYIEMWIHEVKIPIVSLILMCHNHKDIPKEYIEQIRKLDNYVDQVLYYVRSENFEKDCVITETKLSNIIRNVNLKNKDDLLENKIDLMVENVDIKIYTDAKWLEFILNQIINNSIKYKKDNTNSYIKIYTEKELDRYILNIYDNGIGIPKKDISSVFQKSFTGENGRIRSKSTGMGLYIAKNLCEKLGHNIEIESVQNEYTKVRIITFKNDFYIMEDNVTKL